MIKCKGCGIKLQNNNINDLGYTKDINNDLCMRCFKLKNYNILVNDGIKIDNDKLLDSINKKDSYVLFLTDFLSIDRVVIDTYKKIKSNKCLVLTKSDLIPKNIKYDVLIKNIKNIYDIDEDIILCSSKKKYNIKRLEEIIFRNKKVIFTGYTNAGKSSLINLLTKSDITVSKKKNTTQDFINMNIGDNILIDAPGFLKDYPLFSDYKNIIRPKSYQLKKNQYLLIGDISLYVGSDANITIYVGENIKVERRRVRENVKCLIPIFSKQDLVIGGCFFIKFSSTTYINISTSYEIRDSIIGDNNE